MNLIHKLFRKRAPKPKRPYWKKRGFWAIALSVAICGGSLGLGNENPKKLYTFVYGSEFVAHAQIPHGGELTKVSYTQPAVVVEPVPEPETPALLQQRCIAHTIDGEAGGEIFEGKQAVAYVAFNRYNKSGNTPCVEVCKAGQFDGATKACNGGAKTSRPSDEAMDIAFKVMTGEYKAEGCLKDAMYFMNPGTSSYNGAMWILKNAVICATIGNHVFAKDKPAKPIVAQANPKHTKKKSVVVAQVKTTPPAQKPIKLASKK